MNSAEEEVMLDIERGQEPALLIVSFSSTKEPRQTLPILPLSAMAVTRDGVPTMPVANRSTVGAVGSLLMIRIVAISSSSAVGLYTIVNSICAPGAMTSGVLGVERTEKLVEPIRR